MAKSKTTKAPRPKRYKAEDGCYLAITEHDSDEFYVAWYIPEDCDFGGYVGEGDERAKVAPVEKNAWESWTAFHAIEPFADRRTFRGFAFDTRKKAALALAAANLALTTGEAPWPPWAIQAKEAGWTPPKGWKP